MGGKSDFIYLPFAASLPPPTSNIKWKTFKTVTVSALICLGALLSLML